MNIKPRRSALYMPGSNARAMEKAKTLPADAVILDLEDSVAPEAKAEARTRAADAVRAGGYGEREVIVRINGLDTAWGADDLKAVVSAAPDAILLPKVSRRADIASAAGMLTLAPKKTQLWLMIETSEAILHLSEIAAAAREEPAFRLAVLVMGTNDLVKDTRASLDVNRTAALYWLSASVTAARAGGLDILDGVYNDIKNTAGFRAECEHGRMLGFDGKTLIHPDQIAPANEVFAPSAAEIAAARKLVGVFDLPDNQGKGAISVDGRMVERLHAEMARRVVAHADAIAARGR